MLIKLARDRGRGARFILRAEGRAANRGINRAHKTAVRTTRSQLGATARRKGCSAKTTAKAAQRTDWVEEYAATIDTVLLRPTRRDGHVDKEVCDLLLTLRRDGLAIAMKSQQDRRLYGGSIDRAVRDHRPADLRL